MTKILLVVLLMSSTVAVAESKLQLDKTLEVQSTVVESCNLSNSPDPNLILERGLVYTPSTKLKTRVYSGTNNYQGIRIVSESEYWRGN